MQLNASEVVSLLALAGSIGSLLYAKRAVDAAHASNRINLHQPRTQIFQALFDFRRLFVDLDLHPNDDEIRQFYLEAVLPSHVYLPGPLVGKMYDIYGRAAKLYGQIEHESEHGSSERKWELTLELQALSANGLDALIKEVARAIAVGDSQHPQRRPESTRLYPLRAPTATRRPFAKAAAPATPS